MSDVIQHSKLLQSMIDYARAVDGKQNVPFTAERFILTIFAIMEEHFDPKEDARGVTSMLKESGMDIVASKEILRSYLFASSTMSFLDDMYMKKKLAEAQKKAQEQEEASVTPEMLLSCILEDPSKAIRKCLGIEEKQPQARPQADATSEENDRFDALFRAQQQEQAESEKAADTKDAPQAKEAPEPQSVRKKLEELTEKTRKIHKKLSETVFGQDKAVSVFTSGYFQGELLSLTDPKRFRPKATYLFAGPPGVGKTFLAETAAELLELPFKRFDMSEYSDNESAVEFIGADAVFRNAKEGNFTSFVKKNPQCVVLLDEIEKAHISIIHLFLQILDAGRIRDSKTDSEISLKDCIFIFTTNAGRQLYQNTDASDFSDVSRKVILKALQKDVNPTTGQPYFPGAICSRFASGNVVLFNHITAHNLRNIALREALRHGDNYTRSTGIPVAMDDKVASVLLFAEGGAADARTVRSRAESFFTQELLELFRLIGAEEDGKGMDAIRGIRIDVELPEDNAEIRSLFESNERPEAMVFASGELYAQCTAAESGCRLLHCASRQQAELLLDEKELQFVLLDIFQGRKQEADFLNVEDMASEARDLFWHIKSTYPGLPVYLLEGPAHRLSEEERNSFLRIGIRDILSVEDPASFAASLAGIAEQLHQQSSMEKLARSNRVVSFETYQKFDAATGTASICIFDFELATAFDPEDSGSILSKASRPDVTFDKVIGAEDAKQELRYFVDYLKHPKKYRGTGVRAPRGMLLYGPPGTGKTMLAKAMAGESDVTFLVAEGNQFIKQIVGQGPEKVHELFATARKYAPAILFVDEIDAIAKERTGHNTTTTDEILTAFLAEMDGFKNDPNKPVFVLAATNYDIKPGHSRSLDPALMRRFDRKIYIDLPRRDDRIRYMKKKLEENSAYQVSEEKINSLAVRSTDMSLADLESVFEMALRTALRDGSMRVTDGILDEAFETFNSGEQKQWDADTLERVARHEAGHALIAWLAGEKPSYVTVVSRGNHGGYMQSGDREEKMICTRQELLSRIRIALGGRAAELTCYGEEDGVSTGASGDLYNATRNAELLLCAYGMDPSFGLAFGNVDQIKSGPMSQLLRTRVNELLAEQMQNAVEQISENHRMLDALVEALIEKNHLSAPELEEVFRNANGGV